jgi:AraC-like DNA-binding protein
MGFVTHRMHGALGDWTIVAGTPPRLAGIVEHMWHFEGRTAHARERVLPGARFELILHLRGRYGLVGGDAGGVQPCAEASVSGVQTRPFVIEAPDALSTVVGIELTPAGAWRVFGRPLHELALLDVDFADVVGGDASRLLEACHDAPTPEACLRAIAAWIERRIASRPGPDPAASWIAERIRERRGDVSIAALRDAAGFSASRLAATFREQLGATPKIYARLHRFQHAAERIRRGGGRLADIAIETGYYDQAHFTGEFHELSGLTPRAYAASVDYGVGVNVPE